MYVPLLLRYLGIAFVLSAVNLTSAQETPATNPPEFSHDGVWKPIAAVLGGVRLPDDVVKTITLKIDGDHYEVTIPGEMVDKGTVTLDKTTRPKRMTIKGTEGPNKDKTILAIYEMKDEVSMRVCYDLAGKEYPDEFKAPTGTSRYLVGYRRQKPDAEKPASADEKPK